MKKIIIAAITAILLVGCSTVNEYVIDAESAKMGEALCAVGGLQVEFIKAQKAQNHHVVTAYCEAGVTISIDVEKQKKILNQKSTKKEI